jgi:hypothetical protein
MNHMMLIQMTKEEFEAQLKSHSREMMEAMRQEIDGLKGQLNGTRPAFSREEAAQYCGKSLSWFDTMRKNTQLPTHQVGGTPMFKKEDLDKMLLGHEWGRYKTRGNV